LRVHRLSLADDTYGENVGLYSDEVGDTDTEVVSSVSRQTGSTISIHVEHLSVAWVQRRTGSTEGEL